MLDDISRSFSIKHILIITALFVWKPLQDKTKKVYDATTLHIIAQCGNVI